MRESTEHLKNFYFGAANHIYNPEDYKMTDEFLQGLSTIHQQVHNCYAEGTVEKMINNHK
jgi:hypothetical protein